MGCLHVPEEICVGLVFAWLLSWQILTCDPLISKLFAHHTSKYTCSFFETPLCEQFWRTDAQTYRVGIVLCLDQDFPGARLKEFARAHEPLPSYGCLVVGLQVYVLDESFMEVQQMLTGYFLAINVIFAVDG